MSEHRLFKVIRTDGQKYFDIEYVRDVVTCGECKKWHNGWCYKHGGKFEPNDFCSYGSSSEKPNNSTISKMEQVGKE